MKLIINEGNKWFSSNYLFQFDCIDYWVILNMVGMDKYVAHDWISPSYGNENKKAKLIKIQFFYNMQFKYLFGTMESWEHSLTSNCLFMRFFEHFCWDEFFLGSILMWFNLFKSLCIHISYYIIFLFILCMLR